MLHELSLKGKHEAEDGRLLRELTVEELESEFKRMQEEESN
ncbi:Fur-regulated basic protein FbpA [Bacillus sp. RO2]|nr:Fur-regulated basic protein FbpA [Bacillus sp. RO2]NMH72805.1 Fur-regulated basic protein FbpA [Bacillus sp. RO2]